MTDHRPPQQLVFADDDNNFVELAVRYVDGCLGADQLNELVHGLQSSADRRDQFAAICLHLQQLADVCASAETNQPIAIQTTRHRNRWLHAGITAAMITILATLWWFLSLDRPATDVPGPAAKTVALLTNTENSVFEQSPVPMTLGGELPSGPIRLASGSAQIMLKSGAVVDLIGPVQLQLDDPMHVTLTYGQATFLCPSYAQGFIVALPHGAQVEDLGTAFGVRIDEDEPTRIKVTEGRVRVTPAIGLAKVFVAGEEVLLTESGMMERAQNLQMTRRWSPTTGNVSTGSIKQPFEGFAFADGLTIEATFRVLKAEAWDNSRIWSIFRHEGADRVMLALQDSKHINKEYGLPIGDGGYPGFSFGMVTGRYQELDVALDGRDGRPTINALLDGAVHHVVAVYDRAWNTKSLYLDGKLIATVDTSMLGDLQLSTTGAVAEIGQWNTGERFGGNLLGVQIYDGALTVQQIKQRLAEWLAGGPFSPLAPRKIQTDPLRQDIPSAVPSNSQQTPQETSG